jgi:hypothetical protein
MRIPELALMPQALDPEGGFRVRLKFTFLASLSSRSLRHHCAEWLT